jgi:predicted nucleotidyltransferase
MTKDSFDYKQAIKFLAAKEQAEQDKYHQLYLEAKRDFSTITAMIISNYTPEKIYQWGSLLTPRNFDLNSDIDIAVEGIGSTEQFFELYDKALAMTDFSLDLVEMEKISEVHRKSIIQYGKMIYEKR